MKKIDIENVEKYGNTKLIKIVNSHNDIICSRGMNSNSEVSFKYSEVIQELENYKKQLLQYEEQNNKLIQEKEELSITNTALDSQNKEYRKREQKILELLNSTSKPSK